MNLTDRLILTDCDGVILDWQTRFDEWMRDRGYKMIENGLAEYRIGTRYGISVDDGRKCTRTFNNSSTIGFLPQFRDSLYYMDLLYRKHGYKFTVITSLSSNRYSQRLREMNLHNLLDSEMFEDIICLDTGADKKEALMPYRDSGCYWIEDSVINAAVGRDLGLQTFLMEHSHNRMICPEGVKLVANWQQIYRSIVGLD